MFVGIKFFCLDLAEDRRFASLVCWPLRHPSNPQWLSSCWLNFIIIIIIYLLEFFTSALADGLSLEFEWQQVSRTLLSILAVLNNVVVWMVSTRPPTSKSSSPFSNPLVTVPNAPITIGIIVTCMFHSFFSSLARSRYLSFFSHSFSFILWSAGTAKLTILQVLFFLLIIIIRSGLLAEIRWSVCMSKSNRSFCVIF